MKAYIFGAAEVNNYSFLDINDLKKSFIICADGGIKHLVKLGVKPDIIIGDFDSSEKMSEYDNVIEYPSEKDDTDLGLAINYAADNGFSSCIAVGCLGGRLDHTYANICLMAYAYKKGVRLELVDEKTRVLLVDSSARIEKSQYKYVSIFSFDEKSEGIILDGFKYPLKDAVLNSYYPLGISNEIKDEFGVIKSKKGKLIVMLIKE